MRFAYRQVELAEAVYAQAVAAAEYAARLLETAEQAAGSGSGPCGRSQRPVTLAEAEREVMAAYFDLVVRRVTLWHLVGRFVVVIRRSWAVLLSLVLAALLGTAASAQTLQLPSIVTIGLGFVVIPADHL